MGPDDDQVSALVAGQPHDLLVRNAGAERRPGRESLGARRGDPVIKGGRGPLAGRALDLAGALRNEKPLAERRTSVSTCAKINSLPEAAPIRLARLQASCAQSEKSVGTRTRVNIAGRVLTI